MQFEFENCLLDTDVRELRRGAETVSVEPQVFDLLVYLVQNHDRVVTKDDLIASIWGGRIVSEVDAHQPRQRGAQGDRRQRQGSTPDPHRTAQGPALCWQDRRPSSRHRKRRRTTPSRAHARTSQDIKFCTASDGVRIAYAEVGSGPPLSRRTGSTILSTTGKARSGAAFFMHSPLTTGSFGTINAAMVCQPGTSPIFRSKPSFATSKALLMLRASKNFRCSAFRRAARCRSPIRSGIPNG